MSLAGSLKSLIKGEVVNDEKALHYYSGDASAFRIMPKVAVFPKEVEDIKALVGFVRDHKHEERSLSLTARSAGTGMTGGSLNTSIIVDISKHINRLIEIGRDYAVVQPGMYYRDFETETLKKGLLMPSYPASKSIASVGGVVANNSGGEKTLAYGKTEKYVRKLKMVLADGNEYEFSKLTRQELDGKLQLDSFEGEVYRRMFKLVTDNYDTIQQARPKVSKNSTGYLLWNVWDREKQEFDLAQIFVGSQGTLGIITEITFGLIPVKKHTRMFVIYLNEISKLAEIVRTILATGPTSLESYDDKTLKLALKYAPQLAVMIGKNQNLFKFTLSMLPDFAIILRHGFPKLVVMVEYTADSHDEIGQKMDEIEEKLKPFKLPTHRTKNEMESAKYWTIRRQSFNLLRKRVKGKQTVPFIDDIIVNPEVMPEFLPKLNAILEKYPQLVYTVAGHVGNGNFHIIPLMDMTDEKQRSIIPELMDKVFDLVLQYGGSLSAEHNDGLIRGPYLKKMYGERVFNLFKEVKNIFDPHNIFNPHKKTDADLDYSLSFLKKDNEHSV